MKFLRCIYILCLCLVPSFCMSEVWDDTKEGNVGATGVITDSTAPSTIDDHIRMVYQQTRRRAGVGHHWGPGDVTADDNGIHRLGSARCFFQDSPPTAIEIALYDNTTETAYQGSKDLNDFADNSAAGIVDDIGHGRCWIDSNDNNQLWVYRGVAGDNTPSTIAEGWEPVNQHRSVNFVLNGSFEATDGDGVISGTTGLPEGWQTLVTPVLAYEAHTGVTEGVGFRLKSAASGAADEGVQQLFVGLKPSTQYRLSVRVAATSGDTCQLKVTGHTSVIPSAAEVETSSTSWVTLSLLATTDATPSNVTMYLVSENDGDICFWDHASLVEVAPKLSVETPAVLLFTHVDPTNVACDATYAGTCAALAQVNVTAPGPGYIVIVTGQVVFTTTTDGVQCWVRLYDGTTQRDAATFHTDGNNNDDTLSVRYVTANGVTPGSITTWSLQAKDEDGICTAIDSKIDVLLMRSGS